MQPNDELGWNGAEKKMEARPQSETVLFFLLAPSCRESRRIGLRAKYLDLDIPASRYGFVGFIAANDLVDSMHIST